MKSPLYWLLVDLCSDFLMILPKLAVIAVVSVVLGFCAAAFLRMAGV